MKKLLAIIVLGLFWSANVNANNMEPFRWNVQTSLGTKFYIDVFPKSNDCTLGIGQGSCSFTRKGSTYFFNIQNGHFIMQGSKSFFSNKISGKWKSKNKNNPTGEFWGTREKWKPQEFKF